MNSNPELETLRGEMAIIKHNKQATFSGIYLTLLSIIASVAIGLAVTQLRHSFESFVSPVDLLSHTHILKLTTIFLCFATLVIIGTILDGYALTISYFYWQIGAWDIFIPLALGFFLCLISVFIDQPKAWILWVSLLGFTARVVFWRTTKLLEKDEVPLIRVAIQISKIKESTDKFKEQTIKSYRKHKRNVTIIAFPILVYFIFNVWKAPTGVETFWYPLDVIILSVLAFIACVIILYQCKKEYGKRGEFIREIGDALL